MPLSASSRGQAFAAISLPLTTGHSGGKEDIQTKRGQSKPHTQHELELPRPSSAALPLAPKELNPKGTRPGTSVHTPHTRGTTADLLRAGPGQQPRSPLPSQLSHKAMSFKTLRQGREKLPMTLLRQMGLGGSEGKGLGKTRPFPSPAPHGQCGDQQGLKRAGL